MVCTICFGVIYLVWFGLFSFPSYSAQQVEWEELCLSLFWKCSPHWHATVKTISFSQALNIFFLWFWAWNLYACYFYTCLHWTGAIKFNDTLSRDECHSLVASLSGCQLPFQCAHGRPSIVPLVDVLHLDKDHTVPEHIAHLNSGLKVRFKEMSSAILWWWLSIVVLAGSPETQSPKVEKNV